MPGFVLVELAERQFAAGNPTLRFKRVAAGGDPMTEWSPMPKEESAALPVTSADEQPAGGSYRAVAMRMESRLAPAGALTHAHEVTYDFPLGCGGPQELRLGPAASVKEVLIDGQPALYRREPTSVKLSVPAGKGRTVMISYATPAGDRGLTNLDAIPLPTWPAGAAPFVWRIHPSGSRACSDVSGGRVQVVETHRTAPLARLLGPLARRDEWWREPLNIESEAAAQGVLGIVELAASENPTEVKLTVWDRGLSRAWSWVVFSGLLLIGLLLRQTRSRLLRSGFPLWTVGLMVVAWSVPEPYVPMVGAGLLATLLVGLLPRRVVVRDSATRPSTQVHATTVVVGRMLLVGLLGGGLWVTSRPLHGQTELPGSADDTQPGQSAALVSPPPVQPSAAVETPPMPDALLPMSDGVPSETAYVSKELTARIEAWRLAESRRIGWIIQSADYELLMGKERELRAVFDIAMRVSSQPVPVTLAIQNVVFSSSQDVKIDGATAAIIPTPDGSGVIVTIPPDPEDSAATPASIITERPWTVKRIELSGQLLADAATSSVRVDVPPIVNATARFIWPEGTPENFRCSAWGPVVSSRDGQSQLVHLGGRRTIEASWGTGDESATSVPAATQVSVPVSRLILTPLRIDGESWLGLPGDPIVGRTDWVLPLPTGMLVESVSGDEVSHWRQTAEAGSSKLMIETSEPVRVVKDVQVRFCIARATTVAADTNYQIPRLWSGPIWSEEYIGVGGISGETLELPPAAADEGAALVGPEDWLAALQGRPLEMPPVTIRLGEGTQLAVRLSPRLTTQSAVVEQSLRIGRTIARYELVADLNVRGAAAAVQSVRLDPRLRLQQVSVEQDGADRLSRLVRDADQMRLFLSRPYLGMLRLRITAELPVTPDELTALPELTLADTTMEASRWTLYDESDWTLELSPRPANEVPGPRDRTLPVATFFSSDAGRPEKFRVLPGRSAIAAQLATQIRKAGDGRWLQRTSAIVRPVDAPLREVRLSIPDWMEEGLQLLSRGEAVPQSVRDGDQMLLTPHRLVAGASRFSLSSTLQPPPAGDLPGGVWTMRLPDILSAEVKDRLLVIDQDFPFRPTSASATVVSPDQLRAEFRSVSGPNQSVYRLRGPECIWSRYDQQRSPMQIPLSEVTIWLNGPTDVRGRTRLTTVTSEATELELHCPEGVRVIAASRYGESLPMRSQDDAHHIALPSQLQGEPIVIEWESTRTGPERLWSQALPQPVGVVPQHSVATIIPTRGARPVRQPRAEEAGMLCTITGGLLDTVELLTTRSLPLDSPLIRRLRQCDQLLSGELLPDRGWTAARQSEATALRARWKQIQSIIAVNVDVPGAQTAEGLPTEYDFTDGNDDVGLAILTPQAVSIVIDQSLSQEATFRRAATVGGLLAGLLLVIWLRLPTRAGDWLARHPLVASLLLGVLWIAFLMPKIVGVLAILLGLTLIRSRGNESAGNPDTAVLARERRRNVVT
ncbi:MAG: hypothetical protein R3B90_18450 [Planctomycetaceae bacterium]